MVGATRLERALPYLGKVPRTRIWVAPGGALTCKIGCQLYSGDSYHAVTCVFHNEQSRAERFTVACFLRDSRGSTELGITLMASFPRLRVDDERPRLFVPQKS
jgi:hypothetical protein